MKGVTIALGSYEKYARAAADLAWKNLDLDEVFIVRDIDIAHIPALMAIDNIAFRSFATKFFLFDISKYDRFIYFDADAAFVTRPPASQMNLIETSPNFLAVRDRPYDAALPSIEVDVGIPSGTYVNAGMFVVNRDNHYKLFEVLKAEITLLGNNIAYYKYQDQWLLNNALFRMRHAIKTEWLHRYWNAQDWHPRWGILPYCIHTSGNYPRYEGSEPFPEFPQGEITEKPFQVESNLYTADGFVRDNSLGKICSMYHMDADKQIIKY
jgi:Glycosyl transferase family 8